MNREERKVRRDKAINLLKRGESCQAAADATGLAPATVYALAGLAGLRRTGGKRDRVLRVVAAIQRGDSQSSIARSVKVSRQAVHDISLRAQKAGIVLPTSLRGRHGPRGDDYLRVVVAAARGDLAAAKEYGKAGTQILDRMKKMGLLKGWSKGSSRTTRRKRS